MKNLYAVFLCFIFAATSYSSPLIFKTKKTISTDDLTQIVSIDTSKFSRIRISVQYKGTLSDAEEGNLRKERDALIEKMQSIPPRDPNFELSVISIKIEDINKRLSPKYRVFYVGIEGDEEISLYGDGELPSIVDNPPSKFAIEVQGKGTYSIFIWGQ